MTVTPNSTPARAYPAQHVIIAVVLMLLLAMGVRATFGLFMQPMGLVHGWGRDVFSLAFAIQNLTWGFGAILMGMLADRHGSGRTIALSIMLYALGLLGTRFADSTLTLYLSAGVLVGLGQAGTTFAVLLPVVARAVSPEQRSTAMGIASAGGSLGQFSIVPFGQYLIDGFQWSGALLILSALMAMALPLTLRMTGRPEVGNGPQQSLSEAIKAAVRHPSYHFLFWSYCVCGFHTAFITLHLPAFVVDSGLQPSQGALALALIGLFNVFGSFYAGKLGGSYSKKNLLAAIYGLRGLAILFLLLVPITPLTLYVFAAAMGVLWLGTVPLTNGLVGQIYGMRYAATLSGIVFLGHQVGSFVGVYMGGELYVSTGSYTVVWVAGVALAGLAAVLCLPIREQPLQRPASA